MNSTERRVNLASVDSWLPLYKWGHMMFVPDFKLVRDFFREFSRFVELVERQLKQTVHCD